LLAGGLSRRMGGGDKCLRPLAGRAMLTHVIDRVCPQVSQLVINANGDAERFGAFGLPVVADPVDGFVGPLAGVLAGMRWTTANAPKARWVLSAPSDAPFLPADLVVRLRSALQNTPDCRIALAHSSGRVHPVVGLWPVDLADDLEAALRDGIRKVLHWTDRHGTVEVDFQPERIGPAEIDPFFNANRPEEIEAAAAFLTNGTV
jgi:molybdopterin-guanine dinucleotide biosynthesis protein A